MVKESITPRELKKICKQSSSTSMIIIENPYRQGKVPRDQRWSEESPLYINAKKKKIANTILRNLPILQMIVEQSNGQVFDKASTVHGNLLIYIQTLKRTNLISLYLRIYSQEITLSVGKLHSKSLVLVFFINVTMKSNIYVQLYRHIKKVVVYPHNRIL